MEETYNIVINVYDLTQGLAKLFTPMLINKQVDAIYHTGIAIFNLEYFYGGGIQKAPIKQTPYGQPVQEIQFGKTHINKETFEEFLAEINDKFSTDKYDLIKNNCNHFVEECCQFLTGQGLPKYIIDQPNDLLNTSLGQMLRPMIENIERGIQEQTQASAQSNMPANLFLPQFFEGQNNMNQMFPQSIPSQQQPQQQQWPAQVSNPQPSSINTSQQSQQQYTAQIESTDANSLVTEINGLEEYMAFFESSDAMIIDIYADWCGPCKMIKPIFNEMAQTYQEIQFYRINGDKNQELIQQFGVKGYPTFITFYKQQKVQQFSGANQIKLKDALDQLKQMIKQKTGK